MSEEKVKKASEVLVDMDRKVDILIEMVRALDLNMKIISNKINGMQKSSPKFIAETTTVENNLIGGNFVEEKSFEYIDRRGSRNDAIPNTLEKPKKVSEVIVSPTKPKEDQVKDYINDSQVSSDALIPTMQKIMYASGKVVFLANVQAIDVKTKKITGTKTNGAGIWQMPLPLGTYDLVITKRMPGTNELKEIKEKIIIDGSQVPFKIKEMRFS